MTVKNRKQSSSAASHEDPVLSHSEVEKKVKKEIKYEFFGPIGTANIIISLPFVILGLFALCTDSYCMDNPFTFPWTVFLQKWFSTPSTTSLASTSLLSSAILSYNVPALFDFNAILFFLGWFFLNVLLERVLPGENVLGTLITDKKKNNQFQLTYVLSGHLQFWVLLLLLVLGYPSFSVDTTSNYEHFYSYTPKFEGFKPFPLDYVYDHYYQIAFSSILFSFIMSTFLYVNSFIPKGKVLAAGGNTGNVIYDFFIGRELNPRIGSLDLKEFCELRPGLIGWAFINICMAYKQYQNLGYISFSMFFVTLLQGIYVWDGLYNEKSILTTMDITSDGFGFMLCFGDLAWVPFIYTLQARYLVDHDPSLSLGWILIIFSIYSLGFFIFRSANKEKDLFRSGSELESIKNLKFMNTKRGTKLLISGWWGMARKINYTGDWLITLSWCLFCGLASPVPYFQAIYFAILLIHRAMRDDEACHEKYGDDWIEYKKKVPYMFIPFVV